MATPSNANLKIFAKLMCLVNFSNISEPTMVIAAIAESRSPILAASLTLLKYFGKITISVGR